MKRGWMIVLLMSLGLNIGLGLNLLRRAPAASPLPVMTSAPSAPEDLPDPATAERFMRRRLDRMTRELGLDERQQADLWTLHRDVGREVFGRRHAMAEARRQLYEAYADPDANAESIQASVRRISAMQSDLDSMIVAVMLREREVLRPEQRLHYHSLIPMGPQRFPSDLRRGTRHGRQQAH